MFSFIFFLCFFMLVFLFFFFFFQAEDGIRDLTVTGVQTCALPIWHWRHWWRQRRVLPGLRAASRISARSRSRPRRSRTSSTRSKGRAARSACSRSEERRVGKECRSRWWPYHEKKKDKDE